MTDTKKTRNQAFGQIHSVSTSAINAIMRLQALAEDARVAGDDDRSTALILKANEISAETSRIYRAKSRMRARASLRPLVGGLRTIASDAQDSLRQMKKAARAIQAATEFVGILKRLTLLVA